MRARVAGVAGSRLAAPDDHQRPAVEGDNVLPDPLGRGHVPVGGLNPPLSRWLTGTAAEPPAWCTVKGALVAFQELPGERT